MPVKNYDTIDGEIIGECTNGVYTDYGVDALGSVVATIDSLSAVVNTYRYKPYGALLAKTGVGSDPRFGWVGTQGYRSTKRVYSDSYVRARHQSSEVSTWTTVDPIWPPPHPYAYVQSNPTRYTDPSGLKACAEEASIVTKLLHRVHNATIDVSPNPVKNKWNYRFYKQMNATCYAIGASAASGVAVCPKRSRAGYAST
jgi:RHS repeat-associated protein